ncbi:hypothetical protein evm_002308 [Chilo suppressalis]|nr:hypothetical protein evm_002308 [Chilo suppressalis]
MDGKGRLGHDSPRGSNVDWRVLTTADAAGTDGLTCLPKHGETRDRRFLVTHPMTDHCESCLTSTIADERANHPRNRWYLQRRAFSWHNRSVLAVPLAQTLCVTYAAVCALTRLTDHRHHWWDVLVGGAMGTLAALYTVLVLCKNFSQPAVVSTSDISSSDGNNHQSVRRLLSSEPHVVVP